MSVRVRYGLTAAISSTTAESKDLGDGSFEVVDDSLGEGGARKITLPGSAVDVAISMCDVADAKFLAIRVEPKDPNDDAHRVNFRLNSPTGDEIPIIPLGSDKEAYLMMTTTGLVSLYATNTGATDMSLTLFVAGD